MPRASTKTEENKKETVKKAVVEKTKKEAVSAKSRLSTGQKKETVKVAIKKAESTVEVSKSEKKVNTSLTLDVYDLEGKVSGKISLPEEIFGEKVNKTLLAQAVRVYLANKRQGNASTKTRGEVDGSTRKIYRQKGTGRARHGSIRAPIFVHGGVVFGPKPRDYSLDLPKKMRRKALFSALSSKLIDGEIKILSGLETLEPKTKQFVTVIKKLGIENKKKKLLIITGSEQLNIKLSTRNLEGVTVSAVQRVNAYDILKNKQLLFMKEAIETMQKYYLSNK